MKNKDCMRKTGVKPESGPVAGQLRVGAARIDITPEPGIQLAGMIGIRRPAGTVSDPLYAKALVVESGGKKVCFVSLDLVFITRQYSHLLREKAVRDFGLEYDAIMIHPLQIHSAPTLGHFLFGEDFKSIPPDLDWLRGGDERYHSFCMEKIMEVIGIAHRSLNPVQIGVGSGVEGRMASNRRGVTPNGTVRMPWFWDTGNVPLGPTDIRYLEGPMDPELGVMCFRNESGQFLAIAVNYTCHPVVVFAGDTGGCVVSADWPGAVAEELVKIYGNDTVALVLNGACGNINPWNPFDPDYGKGDHKRMGRVLAGTAEKVIERMEFKKSAVIAWKSRHLKIPVRKINKQQIEEAGKILREHPEPVWINEQKTRVDKKWLKAAMLLNVYSNQQKEPELDYEIQVFRIGDTAFVGLPGEPFAEIGLRIKLHSSVHRAYIVHAVNQVVGYIPTKEAFKRGGHEVDLSAWSKLVPEAADMIVDAAINMLKEIFE